MKTLKKYASWAWENLALVLITINSLEAIGWLVAGWFGAKPSLHYLAGFTFGNSLLITLFYYDYVTGKKPEGLEDKA